MIYWVSKSSFFAESGFWTASSYSQSSEGEKNEAYQYFPLIFHRASDRFLFAYFQGGDKLFGGRVWRENSGNSCFWFESISGDSVKFFNVGEKS